ncbi:FtsX-like permease family protein [Sporosarcina sp. NPDC096371]|uniref:FtsX-like permease family protein n=1 Tax=Sporosarcina sp. NPDC096371 TaxID=3364530 RepID=UPI00380E53D9
MTLFDLVIRSMRKNIKHYYLYFFALIFSVVLYFVFATLQHDAAVIEKSAKSMNMAAAFKAAGILLIFIAGIFVVYANAIFLKRRSREIGLYQLIGLTKGAVARLLIIENALLGAGALIIGIGAGMLVSRVFLLLLMKLIGYDGFIAVSFSLAAIIQTAVVFVAIIILTSAQMLVAVYRNTLLDLFNADKKGEHPKKPKTVVSAVLALLGIGLIIYGYWLSGRMINEMLFFNMLAVLASTILGTYLVFRVTISWLFYQIRARKQGHLGLHNSLSLAPLMHRMKANANSLTIITVLSAMTLAMVAGSYSLFYSSEKMAQTSMPFDFTFTNYPNEEGLADEFAEELKVAGIDFKQASINALDTGGMLDISSRYWSGANNVRPSVSFYMAEQLRAAGKDVQIPPKGSAISHDMNLHLEAKPEEFPATLTIMDNDLELPIQVVAVEKDSIMNMNLGGSPMIVSEETFAELEGNLVTDEDSDWSLVIETFQVPDDDQRAKASAIFMQDKYAGGAPTEYRMDYHTLYQNAIQTNGLLIFIAGFLGLVFLISTGSILYFKQMTEAEQEKQGYATMRQLGFTVQDIMRGIVRKQLFVFGVPLLIGLLHSIFAIKAASFLFMSDITVPASIAMSLYALIYLVFAFLTVGYYRKTVKAAL